MAIDPENAEFRLWFAETPREPCPIAIALHSDEIKRIVLDFLV
jgi:hypothetical protein